MTLIIPEIEDILTEYLRKEYTDPQTRIVSATEAFTATAAQTAFTLAHPLMSHITTCTVNAAAKTIWEDFYIVPGKTTSQVIFDSGLALNDAVSITYGYITGSNKNWIYPQYPNIEPTAEAAFPLIAITQVSSIDEQNDSNGSGMESVARIALRVFTGKTGIAIDGTTWSKQNAARKLCRSIYATIKDNWRDDLAYIIYNFTPIMGPVNEPFEERNGVYRSMCEFYITTINQGESR